jgi:alkyl sulfatase BDS1-like metallo-beta-lactamase superfamily hydrolase
MAFNQRAWFRATCPDPSFRDPRGAVDDAKKACNITNWREADPIDTLAVASAENGDFESAARYVEKAMQAYDSGEMTKTLQQHLATFKEHRRVTGH